MSRVRWPADRSQSLPAPVAGPGAAPSPDGPAFAAHLRAAGASQVRARLDELLNAVDAAAARLVEGRTLADLRNYREAVRNFLAAVQREARAVDRDVEWDYQEWQHRTLTVVRMVDERLEALARAVLEREADRLDLLARIGEIKGLLLDLRV